MLNLSSLEYLSDVLYNLVNIPQIDHLIICKVGWCCELVELILEVKNLAITFTILDEFSLSPKLVYFFFLLIELAQSVNYLL